MSYANIKTCVLIHGHTLVQSIAKPHGCQTFDDPVGMFIQNATLYFGIHITMVNVVL